MHFVEVGIGQMNWSYISQIAYGPFWISGFYLTSINLAILIAVTILALAYRRVWCRICPLGAITALFSTFTPFKQIALTKLQKDEHKCTKCGVCKRVCPTQATAMYRSERRRRNRIQMHALCTMRRNLPLRRRVGTKVCRENA